MNNQSLSPSQNSLKSRFALRFIRSLARIKAPKHSHTIKLAADASMASAVGSTRSWSRAVLFKIRNRARLHALAKHKLVCKNKKRKMKNCKKKFVGGGGGGGGGVQEGLVGVNGLRRVVPGGESMDLFKLLEETAHYMKCLNTQVEVMQSIVDLYSPST